MGDLIKILKEIRVTKNPQLVKGRVYDIRFPGGEVRTNMEYNGPNIHGDHLFFNTYASGPTQMNWTYIDPIELNKYIITPVKNINELGDKKVITKLTHHDPNTNSTTWSVSYRPDLNGLINYLDKIIRKYRDLIKKNKLERDQEIIKNYETLRQVRRELYKIIETRYPELLDKIHKL